MKNRLILFIFCMMATNLSGQKLKLVDSLNAYRTLLSEYWQECVQHRYFFEDKGVVKVIAYTKALKNKHLILSAMIDD
jgi:hypothetical protein